MANPIAACILITFCLIFTSQIILEYYIYISQMTQDGSAYSSNAQPRFIRSNKVFNEEIQNFILDQEEKIQKINQQFAQKKQLAQKQYHSL